MFRALRSQPLRLVHGSRAAAVRAGAAACSITLLASCSITTTIKPTEGVSINEVCIMENQKVMMDGFLPALKEQIEARGVKTRVFRGAQPDDCKYHLEYTATWRWDMAMYLTYADLTVYEKGNLIGEATYDARWGGGRPDKFGATAGKLKGLTEALFRKNDGHEEAKDKGQQQRAQR